MSAYILTLEADFWLQTVHLAVQKLQCTKNRLDKPQTHKSIKENMKDKRFNLPSKLSDSYFPNVICSNTATRMETHQMKPLFGQHLPLFPPDTPSCFHSMSLISDAKHVCVDNRIWYDSNQTIWNRFSTATPKQLCSCGSEHSFSRRHIMKKSQAL